MNKPKGSIIVKVQQSSGGSDKEKSILVYDKSRVLFFESRDPGIVKPLVGKLGDSPKKYFRARVENQELKIFEEIKGEKW